MLVFKNDKSISPAFSLYLDIIRFFAAFAVFLHHLESYPFTNGTIWPILGSYGGIAVTIFFVLSGFVIAHVVATKEQNAPKYIIARVSRIYSVVIVALALTVALDNLGLLINKEYYLNPKVMMKPQSVESYLYSFFFLNEYQIFDLGGISPGTNGPYWSLSFEVTYYLIAGLVLFFDRRLAIPLSILILFAAGRTIAILFPLWLLGYGLYHVRLKTVATTYLRILSVVSLMLLFLTPLLVKIFPENNWNVFFPWGRSPFNRFVIKDYLAAIFLALHLLCIRDILSGVDGRASPKVADFIRWCGSLTFPLYLVHFPVLCFFGAISPFNNKTGMHVLFLIFVTFAIVIAVTPFCDNLKNSMRDRLRLLLR